MNESDTKVKILNAAEGLFAHEGFHATSLRAITGKAGVNIAAVNYHFGSKDSLLEAVFERRLIPLNEVRLARLKKVMDDAGQGGERPGVADIMRAFIEPTVLFKESGQGAKDFVILVGRSFAEPDGGARKAFLKHLLPTLEVFYDALEKALPDAPRDDLVCRFRFAIGAMAHTIQSICDSESIPERFRATCDMDPERMVDMLVDFVTSGIESR